MILNFPIYYTTVMPNYIFEHKSFYYAKKFIEKETNKIGVLINMMSIFFQVN